MSTRYRCCPRVKKLSKRVRPGVLLVLTRDFLCRRALRRLDFPTLDLPAKAISGNSDTGSVAGSDADVTNWL